MLELVQLSPRLLFPPGGLALYRHVARLTRMSEGAEVLVAACGNGVTLDYFVGEHGVHGAGVDSDESLTAAAEWRARERGLLGALHFQRAPLGALPYRDGVFDVSVGELGLTSDAEPAVAVGELVRTTRPGGAVVLVQLVWTAPVEGQRRRVLSEHLGVRPLMLVEWKRLLRGSGVERLHTEDWSVAETAFRPAVKKPFPDFAEIFSVAEKLVILRRAWRRWGWRAVRTVLQREREVHRLLTRERILALDLIVGWKAVPAEAASDGGPEAGGGEAPADAPTSVPPDEAATAVESGRGKGRGTPGETSL